MYNFSLCKSKVEEGRELFSKKSSEGVLKSIVGQKTCDEKRTPPSSKTVFLNPPPLQEEEYITNYCPVKF